MKQRIYSQRAMPNPADVRAGDGPRSIAVRLKAHGDERVLLGQATVEYDTEMGAVMLVTFSLSDDGSLLLSENAWRGKTESGASFGCDLLICIN